MNPYILRSSDSIGWGEMIFSPFWALLKYVVANAKIRRRIRYTFCGLISHSSTCIKYIINSFLLSELLLNKILLDIYPIIIDERDINPKLHHSPLRILGYNCWICILNIHKISWSAHSCSTKNCGNQLFCSLHIPTYSTFMLLISIINMLKIKSYTFFQYFILTKRRIYYRAYFRY